MPKFTKRTLVINLLESHDLAMDLFEQYGFRCVNCVVVEEDSIEVAGRLHEKDFEPLLEAINSLFEQCPRWYILVDSRPRVASEIARLFCMS